MQLRKVLRRVFTWRLIDTATTFFSFCLCFVLLPPIFPFLVHHFSVWLIGSIILGVLVRTSFIVFAFCGEDDEIVRDHP